MNYDEILHQLIIKLKMDGVELVKSTDAINKDLDKLEKNTGKTQGRFKQLAAQTNQFGKEGADAFAAVRREALSYFAIITGGRGLTSFIRDTTKAGVSLDNLSRQLGISRQNLLQYRYALEAVGSDGGGYEKMLATIQAMARTPKGFQDLQLYAPQLGVKLLNDDNTVKSDILDQLNKSKAFRDRDRGNQQLLLSKIGGDSDLLNLIDSPRYKSIVNSPEFQGLAPTEEQVRQSKQLLEDWIKFQAETSKIFSRVYSDIQPVADGIVKALTAIERSNPREIATGLEVLAGAIVVLGTAALGSPLLKVGKTATGLASGAAKGLGLKWGAKQASKLVVKPLEWLFDKSAAWFYEEGVKGVIGRGIGRTALRGALIGEAISGPIGWSVLGVDAWWEAYKHREGIVKGAKAGFHWGKDAYTVASILRKGGLSLPSIIGVLANIQHESQFNPHLTPPNGEHAYGLLQWHPDRQKEFKRVFGHDIRESTLEEQAEFIAHELHHTEKAAFKVLQRARSAAEAGAEASLLYVRPRDKLGEAESRADLAEQISASLNASSGTSAQTNHFNVTLGDINVTSHAASPAHVANEVNASTSGHLKATLDEFRKSIVQQNAGGIY